jgi:hypothetical protein
MTWTRTTTMVCDSGCPEPRSTLQIRPVPVPVSAAIIRTYDAGILVQRS